MLAASAGVRRSIRYTFNTNRGRSVFERQGKQPEQAINATWTAWSAGESVHTRHSGLQSNPENGTMHVGSGFIWGIPVHIPLRGDGDDRYRPCVVEMLAARRKNASLRRN